MTKTEALRMHILEKRCSSAEAADRYHRARAELWRIRYAGERRRRQPHLSAWCSRWLHRCQIL